MTSDQGEQSRTDLLMLAQDWILDAQSAVQDRPTVLRDLTTAYEAIDKVLKAEASA